MEKINDFDEDVNNIPNLLKDDLKKEFLRNNDLNLTNNNSKYKKIKLDLPSQSKKIIEDIFIVGFNKNLYKTINKTDKSYATISDIELNRYLDSTSKNNNEKNNAPSQKSITPDMHDNPKKYYPEILYCYPENRKSKLTKKFIEEPINLLTIFPYFNHDFVYEYNYNVKDIRYKDFIINSNLNSFNSEESFNYYHCFSLLQLESHEATDEVLHVGVYIFHKKLPTISSKSIFSSIFGSSYDINYYALNAIVVTSKYSYYNLFKVITRTIFESIKNYSFDCDSTEFFDDYDQFDIEIINKRSNKFFYCSSNHSNMKEIINKEKEITFELNSDKNKIVDSIFDVIKKAYYSFTLPNDDYSFINYYNKDFILEKSYFYQESDINLLMLFKILSVEKFFIIIENFLKLQPVFFFGDSFQEIYPLFFAIYVLMYPLNNPSYEDKSKILTPFHLNIFHNFENLYIYLIYAKYDREKFSNLIRKVHSWENELYDKSFLIVNYIEGQVILEKVCVNDDKFKGINNEKESCSITYINEDKLLSKKSQLHFIDECMSQLINQAAQEEIIMKHTDFFYFLINEQVCILLDKINKYNIHNKDNVYNSYYCDEKNKINSSESNNSDGKEDSINNSYSYNSNKNSLKEIKEYEKKLQTIEKQFILLDDIRNILFAYISNILIMTTPFLTLTYDYLPKSNINKIVENQNKKGKVNSDFFNKITNQFELQIEFNKKEFMDQVGSDTPENEEDFNLEQQIDFYDWLISTNYFVSVTQIRKYDFFFTKQIYLDLLLKVKRNDKNRIFFANYKQHNIREFIKDIKYDKQIKNSGYSDIENVNFFNEIKNYYFSKMIRNNDKSNTVINKKDLNIIEKKKNNFIAYNSSNTMMLNKSLSLNLNENSYINNLNMNIKNNSSNNISLYYNNTSQLFNNSENNNNNHWNDDYNNINTVFSKNYLLIENICNDVLSITLDRDKFTKESCYKELTIEIEAFIEIYKKEFLCFISYSDQIDALNSLMLILNIYSLLKELMICKLSLNLNLDIFIDCDISKTFYNISQGYPLNYEFNSDITNNNSKEEKNARNINFNDNIIEDINHISYSQYSNSGFLNKKMRSIIEKIKIKFDIVFWLFKNRRINSIFTFIHSLIYDLISNNEEIFRVSRHQYFEIIKLYDTLPSFFSFNHNNKNPFYNPRNNNKEDIKIKQETEASNYKGILQNYNKQLFLFNQEEFSSEFHDISKSIDQIREDISNSRIRINHDSQCLNVDSMIRNLISIGNPYEFYCSKCSFPIIISRIPTYNNPGSDSSNNSMSSYLSSPLYIIFFICNTIISRNHLWVFTQSELHNEINLKICNHVLYYNDFYNKANNNTIPIEIEIPYITTCRICNEQIKNNCVENDKKSNSGISDHDFSLFEDKNAQFIMNYNANIKEEENIENVNNGNICDYCFRNKNNPEMHEARIEYIGKSLSFAIMN